MFTVSHSLVRQNTGSTIDLVIFQGIPEYNGHSSENYDVLGKTRLFPRYTVTNKFTPANNRVQGVGRAVQKLVYFSNALIKYNKIKLET